MAVCWEKELVVHRRCGTTIAAANFISSAASRFVMGRVFTFLNVMVLAVANLIGPLLGTMLQKHVTTSGTRDREISGTSTSGNSQPRSLAAGWRYRSSFREDTTLLAKKTKKVVEMVEDKTARDVALEVPLWVEQIRSYTIYVSAG